MPTMYAHYQFGQDVLKKLSTKTQGEINKNIDYYNMFNQGFDNLYFYHYKWNNYRLFAIKIHKNKIDLFFKNMLEYIINNNLQNESLYTNMIYGFINHHTLDNLLHPFINYQTKKLKLTHAEIEFNYDAYLYKKEHFKWDNKFYKIIIPKLKFPKKLITFIDYIFLTTYNKKKMGKIFNMSHNNAYYVYRYFISDFHNLKLPIYYIFDILTNNKIKLHRSTFNINKIDLRILNTQKDIWYYKKEHYNYSLNELYNIALNKSAYLNNLVTKVFLKKESVNKFITEIKNVNLKNI